MFALVDSNHDYADRMNSEEEVVGAAPDIGAYEYGDEHYWFPGPLLGKPSFAVPRTPDGDAQQAGPLPDADLMFLGALTYSRHKVYFGYVGLDEVSNGILLDRT